MAEIKKQELKALVDGSGNDRLLKVYQGFKATIPIDYEQTQIVE